MIELLKLLIYGYSLASIWLLLFILITRNLNKAVIKPWAKLILPQSIIIVCALKIAGLLL